MRITVVYHHPDLPPLEQTAVGDWVDLRAAESVAMKAGEYRLISLGVSMLLPDGYEAHVAPRSSTYKRWGILQTNGVAVIDHSYCGNEDIWHFPALAMRDTEICFGDRICQFRLMPVMGTCELVKAEFLQGPNRGGFGSTGDR